MYNDPAIAIAWLLGQGAERVAYVDVDVHHSDGVQAAFYDDPRVLTISLHQDPAALWPGTRLPSETGGPGAKGSAVNVALPTGTGDAGWLRAFHAVVPPLLRAFRRLILVSQRGSRYAPARPAGRPAAVDRRAARCGRRDPRPGPPGGGRPLAPGRGRRLRAAPGRSRTWAHLLAEAAGHPIDPGARIPAAWRGHASRGTGRLAPEFMTEGAPAGYAGFESGYDPADPLDQAILATRTAVFPEHGMMPLPWPARGRRDAPEFPGVSAHWRTGIAWYDRTPDSGAASIT